MTAPPPSMPPLPPSRDTLSFSELVPLRSKKIRLMKSPFLVFGIVTALTIVMMFANMSLIYNGPDQGRADTITFNIELTVFYFLFIMSWFVHLYSRTDRSVLFYIFPLVVCYVLLLQVPFQALSFVFRTLLPGNVAGLPNNAGFIRAFVAHFFGAGMLEELIKAAAGLIGAALALRTAGRAPASRLAGLFMVRGPLDGLLMGVAAGAMFIFVETAQEYAMNAYQDALQHSGNNVLVAWGAALTLLLPRTIGGITGHMAYAGTFGYFIGLAVIRPRSALKLILVGWIVAASMHAFWNAGMSTPLKVAASCIAVVVFLACLLKARQIEATMRGGAVDTNGSIVVDTPVASVHPLRPAAPQVPAATPAKADPQASALPGMILAIAGQRVGLDADGRIDLACVTALAGRGAGVIGEVTRHPKNPEVLGLKNTGTRAWTVTMTDGRSQDVAPGKNIRLSPGLRIDFGDAIIGLVATK